MGLTDRAVNSLRAIVGADRVERDRAESPSADAQRYAPSSTYAIWGREDIGGLLSVSQNLMDRYADYEAMNDYPDIRCFSGEMKVYVVGEDGIVTPTRIDKLAVDGAGREILAFDRKKKRIVRVTAENPRLSGRNAVIMKIKLSNGAELRVTPEHKILTVESGYVEAKDLRKGAFLVGARNGFELESKSLLTVASPGGVWVSENPIPDGVENVYDVTTRTHNLLVNGVICHNSAFHYFANDATQPNLDNGRVVWIQSPDEALVDAADTLIKRRLRLEDDLFSIAYNLCQYGNDFEEVLVTDNGVVGLNALATPTMRRIEKMNGSLIGFVQDVTGRFTSNQNELRKMLAGSMEIPKHVALFEDWQAVHFRLRSTSRRSPYGASVAEGARWIWKRLVMLEDSVMIYKLCLRGDSQVWTPDGHKSIKDLKEGDEVYSYTTEDKLKRTKVVYKKHNGQDTIYRVHSDHRELFANKTHPVLVETLLPNGRRMDYVEVQHLKPGIHRLVTPKKNEDDWEEIQLDVPSGDTLVRTRVTAQTARKLGRLANRVNPALFKARHDIRLAFLDGVLERHGKCVTGPTDYLAAIRELAMQVGVRVGRVKSNELLLTLEPQPMTEILRGVEEVSADDIWDIGVEADEHNFVANGITVHNTRAPARYAFYVDVTDVPSNRVESFLKRAKRDLKKKKMVNPNNNFLDMRYNPLCLSGETLIPQLDGSEKTLLEMVEAHERGEEQWVYSVDVNDGNKLKPGKVAWAGGTRKNAQLLKITLDNGESIKVTPDHKMIRRSGEFAEAQELRPGDSLMPYYRKRGNVSPAAPDYEMVYDPSDRTYKFVHRVVAEALGIKTGAPDCVIHHEDCNRLNNDPRNLTEMTWADHKALHHKLSRAAAEKLIAYNQTDKARAETAATNREYDKPALMREAITPEIREKQKKAARKSKKAFWKDKEKAAQASKKMRYVYPDAFVDAIRQIIDEQGPKVGAPTIARIANERNLIDLMIEANPEKAGKLKSVHRDMIRWMCHSLGFKNLKEFKASEPIPHNHKVVKIEWLEKREDTYTLTVDTAHTFAVRAGVFVKNSNDEDFFIAVREGRALSRVEVLSGPDYQNTDDVQYFQRKLHGALMVPRAYLGQDEPVQGRAILSNEDVRAARVTLQVQRELKNGIEQLVRTDFAARGFPNPWGLEFEVMMTVPSNIYELAAMEVKNARADFASRVQPYVSLNWIRENVFKLSEEHIAKIEDERRKEASRADRMGMDPIFGAFTGGKPPKPDDQGGAGGLPQEALPPDQGGIMPEQPPAGAPQVAWKEYDRRMRLEEMRDRKSRQNHSQLVDTMGRMMESNSQLARRLRESQQFMKEFTHAAMRNVGGRLVSVPSGNGGRLRTSLR